MIFETERLYVTRWGPGDLNALHELYDDPAIKGSIPSQLTIDETRSIFENQINRYDDHTPFGRFFIVEKASNNFIGILLLKKGFQNRGIQIGYSLKRNYWKKGYATEVVNTGADWIFQTMGFSSISAITGSLNENSKNVLRRCGFLPMKSFVKDGEEMDLFSLEYPVSN